ncbi:MAG: PhnD/SsuA/transferrin family substrate-binding protein [Alcaligenaceae bacterium]|nr:PhnD/SsuA/transferrin family substrate-binding protein [Alcaligenaceae bacterium]
MKGKLLVLLIALLLLVSCGQTTPSGDNSKTIDDLKVVFVPSRDAKDIEASTEPLKGLLTSELKEAGYDVKKVSIETMTSYEAAGEALSAGSAHIGLIPGGTYAAYYDKGVKVVLASTRNGLKYDDVDGQAWNTGEANENNTDVVTYYRGIIVAGPSEKGQAVAAKAKEGTLAWEDVSTAKWCVQSETSGSGYQYPALWLFDNFEKSFPDMKENLVPTQGYGAAVASLANEQCDIAPGFNDIRMGDPATAWVEEYDRENIWTETSVIGSTDKIQTDTVSVSSEMVDDELADAIADAFINLAKTEEGAEAIKIYNHTGYMKVTDADYEGAKKVNELVKSWN